MILGQDLLTEFGLNLKFSEHVIEADDGPFNESTTPMADLGTYIFKSLNVYVPKSTIGVVDPLNFP